MVQNDFSSWNYIVLRLEYINRSTGQILEISKKTENIIFFLNQTLSAGLLLSILSVSLSTSDDPTQDRRKKWPQLEWRSNVCAAILLSKFLLASTSRNWSSGRIGIILCLYKMKFTYTMFMAFYQIAKHFSTQDVWYTNIPIYISKILILHPSNSGKW